MASPPGTVGMVTAIKEFQRSLNSSIDQFVALANESGADPVELEKAQRSVFSISSNLAAETINPVNAMLQFAFMPSLNAAVRTVIDLDLFNLAHEQVTVEEVAKKTGADDILILRLMRALAAFHFLHEVQEGQYQSTQLAQTLAIPALKGWVKVHNTYFHRASFDVSLKVYQKIPSYLANTSYRNPGDVANGATPTRDALGYDYFDYLQHHPTHLADFNSSMKISEALPPAAIPNYPFVAELRSGSQQDPDAVTLVDIGGGRGQFIEALVTANPNLLGRFILQDLHPVIDSLDRSSLGFEAMVHDFFTPQPILGARWYHLRHVLHDWPDSACHKILLATAHAFLRKDLHQNLTARTSTLLITEFVLPDSGCGQQDAVVDLTMMLLNGMERSETQWRVLLNAAGFRVVKIWRAQMGALATIEAELKD